MLLLKQKKNVYLVCRLPSVYNASSQRNNQIKLTHYDETKKRAHDSELVKAKENLKLSHGGPENFYTCNSCSKF